MCVLLPCSFTPLHFHPFPYASGELESCDLDIFRSHCFFILLLRLIFNEHSKPKNNKCLVSMGKSSTQKMCNFCAHREFDLSYLRPAAVAPPRALLEGGLKKLASTLTSTSPRQAVTFSTTRPAPPERLYEHSIAYDTKRGSSQERIQVASSANATTRRTSERSCYCWFHQVNHSRFKQDKEIEN